MRLSDVLKLPKQPHSLSIIKDFLEQPLGHTDYQAAFSYYFDICLSLEEYRMVFDEGEKVLKEIEFQTETPYYEKILKALIDASYHLSKYDEMRTFIDLRKEKLPILKQYLGLMDDVLYKKALQLPYLDDILRIIKDVIPVDVKIYCHQELFELYQKDSQYDMALNQIYELYNYDLQSMYIEEELKILVQLESYDEVIQKALRELRENQKKVALLKPLFEAYLAKEDYHKASTLEAEYELEIDEAEDNLKKSLFELIIKLYQKMDNKPSVDLYTKKLKAIVKVLDKKATTKVETEKSSEEKIVFVEKVQEKKMSHQRVLEDLEKAHDLIVYAHLIDEKLPLREYLRQFFMEVETYLKAKEYIIYLQGESPNLFHYKKERLYDKTILEQLLSNSVVEHVQNTGEEVFEEVSVLRFTKNIITQKDYETDTTFIYCFPLADQGVFLVHFEEEIKDPGLHYDFLKLLSSILLGHLLDEKRLSRLKNENRFYSNVIEAPILAYRELSEHKSTYNEAAQHLFNIDRHHHFELFLRDVSYEHVNKYKEIISKCLNKSGEVFELRYRYQEKHILEKLYGLKIGDEHIVMSLFYNESDKVQEAKALMEEATIDHETDLGNRYLFHKESTDYLEDKASFLLIELDEQLKHIYGTEQMKLYFKEFAQHTKKYFSEGKTYRYDFNQLLVILPYNDIRSVTKIVKEYFRYLDVYESKILSYEKFKANMGILRYPVVTVEKRIDKILRFLDIALEKAKRDKEEKYAFFVYRDYEDELFEQQVIDHLNVAIEEKSLGLVFNQITDIKKNRVWQYESELALLNLSIDNRYLMAIAKKRNRLADLERFHIKKVCEFLVELEKKTERLIKITIPISKETFLDPTFNPYLLGTFKDFGIPYEFVRLKFDMELRPSHYSNQIQELIDRGIALDTTSLDMALSYPFHALHLDMKKESVKWHSYITKVKEMLEAFQMALVIRNVKTKDQKDMLERLGVSLIEGTLYKQLPAPILIQKIKESL
jgi:EAL domain-containing protein (putative c-di-GMP-specific phosphodiesterase class I)/GGDEF domain-containing protein